MGLYDRIFAKFYDRTLEVAEQAGLADRRRQLLGQASGQVLEIGAGTGLNLAYYPEGLTRLVLTEPSGPMAAQLREKLGELTIDAEVVEAPAESLPFEDSSFDTIVGTLVLCTVNDPEASLAEIRRLLVPGGQLLLLEHVRSQDPASAKWQDRFETPWRLYGNGCYCNRDTVSLVSAAGFEFDQLDHGRFPKAPPIVRPLIQGRAVSL
ncbi:MAG: class I SAM-dependent methyltransferase [Solirubrobacterales bacterium]